MFDRTQIEKLLRLNGVDPESPDEVIRSVLLRARWREDDVETAMVVLREDTKTKQKRINTLHKVFRSDDRLDPAMIQSLLGVSVDIDQGDDAYRHNKAGGMTMGQALLIIGVACILSAIGIMVAMWYFQIGPFHVVR